MGGGITGLTIAHHLTGAGRECVVLESREEPGGVIRSRRVDGSLLDWGPQRARLTAGFMDLVAELGLEEEVQRAPPDLDLLVYHGGRLRVVPFSTAAFWRSDLLSAGGKLRAALEPFTRGPVPTETVERFFRRKMGTEAYERLLGPLYGGLYASDPADMIMELSLGKVLEEFGVGRSLVATFLKRGGRISPPPAVNFRDGMQTLPRALADGLGNRVKTGAAVTGLAAAAAGSWLVEARDGRLEAESVVLTAPAPVTARLLETVAPDAAAGVAGLRYNPLGRSTSVPTPTSRGSGSRCLSPSGAPYAA